MFGKKILRAFWAAGLLGILSAAGSWAVTPSIWKVQTQGGFEAGELTNISVNSRGEATLAPSLEQIADTEELYIWCVARDAGGRVYVGTGNNGKVFKATKAGELSLVVDLEEPDVLSLALDKKGNVYAGTSASGTIYKISPAGESSTFFATEEAYVWALVLDPGGNLYAGTGDKGKVYKIAPDGNGAVLYDSPETHIMSLIRGEDGNLYAGGEGSGIIYKISPAGAPFVLYDAAEKEVRCLALDADGVLYAGAIVGGGTKSGAPPMQMMPAGGPLPGAMQGAGVEVSEGEETPLPGPQQAGSMPPSGAVPPARGGPRGPGGPGGGSALYKIAPDGVVSKIWRSPDQQVLSLAIRPGGDLILGTGGEGNLYAVDPDQEEATNLTRSSEAQVTVILSGDRGMIVGSANMGKLYRLGPGHASEGTLESIAHNASTWARWGRATWEGEAGGGTRIGLSTRSGNTEKPDSSWSPWTAADRADHGRIASPNARYVQWRAELKSSKATQTPLLNSVSVSYLQRNLKPRVNFVTAGPRNGGQGGPRNNQGGPSRPPQGGGGPSRPLQGAGGPPPPPHPGGPPSQGAPQGAADRPIKGAGTIRWGGIDANGDQLSYDLFFRGIEEEDWKLLKEDLKKTSHTWDSESFPDGRYLAKVVASDEPSNPQGMALSAERVSDSFSVDNTSPRVENLKIEVQGNSATVTGVAKDAASLLKEGGWAVDGGELAVFFPADEIFDSREEAFSFPVELPSSGEHTLVVRVVDWAGNVGAQKVTVKTKGD